jgi:hypothetical protein
LALVHPRGIFKDMKQQFFGGFGLILCTCVAQMQAHDLSRDFSLDGNPSGVWSHGWQSALGGDFNLLTVARTLPGPNGVPVQIWSITASSTPAIYHNATTNTVVSDGGQGTYPPGTSWYYAGAGNPQNFCVVRFTTPPGGGTYNIRTAAWPAYNGFIQGDTDFHVLHNGVEIFGQALPPGGSAGYTNSLTLAAGDTIDFAIGRGADDNYNGSGLKIDAIVDLAAAPPIIVTHPQSQTVTEGTNVTFGVVVNGSSPLSYQWSRNGAAIDGATAASLTLNNVQASHAGAYSVNVSNAFGSTTSDTAVLTVNPAPPQADYDLSRDFSLVSNPNGVWSYGWEGTLGGVFGLMGYTVVNNAPNGVPVQRIAKYPSSAPETLHNHSATTAISDGGQGTYPPGTTWFYPGVQGNAENYNVIRFTVPNDGDGTYDVATSARPAYDGSIQGDTDFHVLHNGVEVFGRALPPGASAGYTNSLPLAAGDTVDFAIGRGADNSYHGSGLKIEATLNRVSTNPVPPTIVSQPQSQTATEGANVTFSVGVNGSSPLSYQWSRNGTVIDGATAASLTLNNVQLSQSGDYAVVVSNAFGTATSEVAVLMVNPAPDYHLSRDFSLVSNPNGVWSYGWQGALGGPFGLMTTKVTNNAPNGVPVERIAKYLSSAPETLHNHSATTAVSDGGQGTYPPGTVWFYPGVQGYPENYNVIRFTVPNGGDGTYELTTSARPAYDGSIQGDTDFHVLHNGFAVFERALAPGAAASYTNSLTLAAGDTIDFAIGRGADNSYHGSGLKIDATLNLASTNPVPPTIVSQPQSQTVIEGDDVTFGVVVSGSSPLSYQWLRNGTAIDGATAASLTLNNAQLGQAGDYSVSVSNAFGTAASDTAVLTVNPAPPQANYDLSRDFSLVSNPNGVWSYGWEGTLGGAFSLMTYKGVNNAPNGVPVERIAKYPSSAPETLHNHSATTAISDGGQGIYPPGTTWFYPGVQGFPENYNVIRFTVPNGGDGTYDLATSARPAYDGSIQGDTDFHVLRNGVALFEQALAAGASAGYTNSLVLAAGDTIDFAIGRGVDNSYHGSGLKIEATLNVTSTNPVAPTIISQPQSQTVAEGANVTFSLVVSGSLPLSYQWSRNGTAIDGATAASLTLNHVQAGQAGDYSVVVSSPYGTATSGTAVLTVNPAPPQADYDLSRDFSLVSNPNGVWSYGWQGTLGGEFGLMTHKVTNNAPNGVPVERIAKYPYSSPETLHNHSATTATSDGGQGTYPPGTVWFYPGVQGNPENYNVIRFTVPNGADGTYDLATVVRPAYEGSIQGDTDFHVFKNGIELFGQQLAAGGSAGYTNSLALAAADTIDFVVGRGADDSYHGSGLKIEATLNVTSTNPVPPTIVSQPQSQTAELGATVSLGVAVRGSVPLAYQWQFNGTDLPEGTNSTLVLDFVQSADAGNYRVLVSNAYGNATSAVATVTVHSTGVAPTISSQPTGGQFLTGAAVTLSATALGTAPLNYQWYYNGLLLTGAVASSLVLDNIQASQSGTYWLVVTNEFGSATSRGAVVNVLQSTAGGTVRFGNNTNSLVYDVDGATPLPAGTEYLVQLYGGPDASSLQPIGAAVGFISAGRFSSGSRTIVSVPAGAEATVRIKAWEADYGTTYEQALAAGGKTGQSAIFTVVTGGGGSPPSVPADLIGLQSFSLVPGTGSTPPSITGQPVSQTVLLGQSASFDVSADGAGPLLYQWRFNGMEIEGATAAALTMTNAGNAHAGDYVVVVRNGGGAVTSAVATLTVQTERLLVTDNIGAAAEGDLVSVPIKLISSGDVGGMTFVLRYNPDYLSTPEVTWGSVLDGALKEFNETTLGELRFVFAFGSAAVPAGTQSLAVVNLRARSVIADVQSQLLLQIVDVADTAGNALLYGSAAQSGSVGIVTTSSLDGDNNANGRLDVGDATLVLRLLAQLDTTRAWDVDQNDLNGNGILDSGDAIKIIRAAAGIGAPAPLALSGLGVQAKASELSSITGTATLAPDLLRGNPGSLVILQVRLQGVSTPIAGASFTINYPASVLRFRGAQDHRAGGLVPRNAAPVWNVGPSQNNYNTQNGQVRFAVSSSTHWGANSGVLAELTFQVQTPPAGQFSWPVTLSNVEITPDGYQLGSLPGSSAAFTIQPDLGAAGRSSSGTFTFSFAGSGSYVVEASTNLLDWTVLTNVVNATGSVQIADPAASQLPQRFYRTRITE